MDIIIKRNSNNYITLEKNKSLSFYKGDKICFKCEKLTIELDLFNPDNNDSNIKLLSMIFPNNKQYSLEKIREIANLFPSLNEKYYEKTKITAFEFQINKEEATTVVIGIFRCDTHLYAMCFAILGGEYSRNPGTNIMLVDVKKMEDIMFFDRSQE